MTTLPTPGQAPVTTTLPRPGRPAVKVTEAVVPAPDPRPVEKTHKPQAAWRQTFWADEANRMAVLEHLEGSKGPVRDWRRWWGRYQKNSHCLLDDPGFHLEFTRHMAIVGTAPNMAISRMGLRGQPMWDQVLDWANDAAHDNYEIASYYVALAEQALMDQMATLDQRLLQIINSEDGAANGQIQAIDRLIDRIMPEVGRFRTARARRAEKDLGVGNDAKNINHLHLHGPEAIKALQAATSGYLERRSDEEVGMVLQGIDGEAAEVNRARRR